MARYRVLIKPSAVKEIEALDSKNDRRRVVERIQKLVDDSRPPGCTKLSGRDRYRVRQGRYRVVYAIEDDVLLVVVVKVGHRKNVKRGL